MLQVVGGCLVSRRVNYQSDFRYRSASRWCIWRLGRVFGGRKGAISSLPFESTRMRHCRLVVVVLVAMMRGKISRNFFDGVLLSQKTHELLEGSVPKPTVHRFLGPDNTVGRAATDRPSPGQRFAVAVIQVCKRIRQRRHRGSQPTKGCTWLWRETRWTCEPKPPQKTQPTQTNKYASG